jgi:hypothetical protein
VLGAMPLPARIYLHIVSFGIREGPDNMSPELESGYSWLRVPSWRLPIHVSSLQNGFLGSSVQCDIQSPLPVCRCSIPLRLMLWISGDSALRRSLFHTAEWLLELLVPPKIRSPEHPARSQSLYRLSYTAHYE